MRPLLLFLLVCLFFAGAPANAQRQAPAANAAHPAAPAPQQSPEDLFRLHCAVCHGPDGTGTGQARTNLAPPPADLTLGIYKLRTTPAGALPSDEDIASVLNRGIPGTAMPGFRGILKPEDISALVGYVKGLSPRFLAENPAPPFVAPAKPLSGPGGIANGKATYTTLCVSCHGADGRGYSLVPDERGRHIYSTDLTAPWSFKHSSLEEDLFRVISTGIDGTGMPGYESELTEGQRWELVFYIKSIARVPAWVQTDPVKVRAIPSGGLVDPLQRGEYLVRALACGRCHSPANPDGTYQAERALSGGVRVEVWPDGIFYSSNLTPDPETGLGNLSEEEIARAITSGQSGPLGLARLNPYAMPWPYYARMKSEDALAIAAYLKSLDPIYNAEPERDGYGFLATFSGKVEAHLLGAPVTVGVYPGSLGSPSPGTPALAASSRHQLAPVWALATLIGLVIVYLILLFGILPLLRWGRPQMQSAWRAAWLTGILGVLAGALIYFSPLYTFLPADLAADQVVRMPAVVGVTEPGRQALAERGQYIATIAACGTCHSPASGGLFAPRTAPLSGGAEVRNALFGTVYANNLTPDATGIAGWTDVELKRAFQTGRSRDGFPVHWQAMPWDYYSNLREEDAQALAFYLLNLEPQPHLVPSLALPTADDPEWTLLTLKDFGQ